jgi:hypothetical protein
MKLMQRIFKVPKTPRQDDRKAKLYRDLIRHEARIGGELFGPIEADGRREFFCLDAHTWIWHEEWVDFDGKRKIKTTRYDIRPSGILKAQDGQHYQQVTPEEARRLYQAIEIYEQRVTNELYSAVA